MHLRWSGRQHANLPLWITIKRRLPILTRSSTMWRDRWLLYGSVGVGCVNPKLGIHCAKWQHAITTAPSVGSDLSSVHAQIQTLLMDVVGTLRDSSDRGYWQKGTMNKALDRYAKTIRLISEYDTGIHGSQLKGIDCGIEKSELVRNLIQVSDSLAEAICCYTVQCIQTGKLSEAINALVMATEIDCAYDPGHLLSASVFCRLQKQQLGKKDIEAISMAILRIGAVRSLPERFMSAMIGALYRRMSYDIVELCENRLSCNNISASIARLSLLSIRKQQVSQMLQRPNRKSKRLLHNNLRMLGRSELLETVDTCAFCRRARRIVDILWQNDRRSVTEAHLTKLLEIELSSTGKSSMLPRELDLWLRNFVYYDIRPSVKTFTIVTNAYFLHDDHQFAWSIFQGMKHGRIQGISGLDGRVADIEFPQPNSVTLAMVTAHTWSECNQNMDSLPFEEILASTETHGRKQNRLVTSAISALVNSNRFGDAEQTWIQYGCRCTLSDSREQPPNIWAMTKLALGYARAGDVEKAAAFLHEACQYRFAETSQRKVGGDNTTLYLSVVFNAVLCSAIRSASQSKIGKDVAMRRDLYLLRLAGQYRIPLDTTTYNVLLAALSQLVRQDVGDRNELANSMQGLYHRMIDHGVTPDDTTITHLIPLWVHLGKRNIAVFYWQLCSQHRPPRKVGQIRRHVVAMAQHWNLVDKTLDIINQ